MLNLSRVKALTSTPGLSTYELVAAGALYRSWDTDMPTGAVVRYFVTDLTQFERGVGVFTVGSPSTISRDTILESSTGGKINWAAGNRDIFLDPEAGCEPSLAVAGALTIAIKHIGARLVYSGSGHTWTVPSAATLGNGFRVLIDNQGTGSITLSGPTLSVPPGAVALLTNDGSAWRLMPGIGDTHRGLRGIDITAASSIAIPDVGDFFVVTGATGIAGMTFGAAARPGREFELYFSGAPTLTNSAGLLLFGGVNLKAVAADTIRFRKGTGNNVQMVGAPTPPHHSSMCKGWAKLNYNGTFQAAYNVSSVGDLSAGLMEVNWAQDFASAEYAAFANAVLDPGGAAASTITTIIGNTSLAAGTTRLYCIVLSTFAGADTNFMMVGAFGDQ
jgi:hypothetical protein